MRYDCLKDKLIDEALDEMEKNGETLPQIIFHPVWNGKEWVYEPIKKS